MPARVPDTSGMMLVLLIRQALATGITALSTVEASNPTAALYDHLMPKVPLITVARSHSHRLSCPGAWMEHIGDLYCSGH
ncbi:hypothetical protein FIBSPDRAFT_260872 [Athelia psychrophila]|uniref:Uncharacterized protein n=1 Tax=Athelia psychrophila TaxID=1759441 RepID=A0A166RR01_9AGAM|nr:hypothetical protein FIBSPDRAFT_260872 [Fibularhizoctonia sp. CBS 109695]